MKLDYQQILKNRNKNESGEHLRMKETLPRGNATL